MDRATWLLERQQYIGSTDIVRLLRLAPDSWGGPHRVWLDKVLPPDNDAANDWGYWGRTLEPLIASKYGEVMGREVRPWEQDHAAILVAEDYDHVAATPDWYEPALEQGDVERIIECKTASAFMSDDWGPTGSDDPDDVPVHYLRQLQWQMGCGGHGESILTVLIGGQDWRWYPVFADPAWFATAAQTADEWYVTYVLGETPPTPDQRTDIVLGQPPERGMTLRADDDLEATLEERAAYKLQADAAMKHVKRLDAEVVWAMGSDYDQINRRDGTVAVTHRAGKTGKRRLTYRV